MCEQVCKPERNDQQRAEDRDDAEDKERPGENPKENSRQLASGRSAAGIEEPPQEGETMRITTVISAMIRPCRVAGSVAQAISGISVRKASSSSPLAIARNAQKQDGGHGSTVAVRRWVRGCPHSRGRMMVTAAASDSRRAVGG